MEKRAPKELSVWRMANGPALRVPWATLVWPGPNETKMGVICQWPLHQLLVHHVDGTTLVCVESLGEGCSMCDRGYTRRWCGYAGCYDLGAGRHILMQVTVGAAVSCPALLTEQPSLVNWRLRIARIGGSKRSRCKAELLPAVPGSVAPDPIDYAAVLRTVFGFTHRNGAPLSP